MKILEVNKYYPPWIGGIETVVKQVAEGFSDRGQQVTVLCCSGSNDEKIESQGGVLIIRVQRFFSLFGMPISLSFFRWYRRLVGTVDVVHIHYPFPLAFFAAWLFPSRAKLIIHYHADVIKQRYAQFFLLPLLHAIFSTSTAVVVTSEALRDTSVLLRKYVSKCSVIPIGVPFERLCEEVRTRNVLYFRDLYGVFVLSVGRLSRYKGLPYLIHACRRISAHLVIAGIGDELHSLRMLVKQLGANDAVVFLPHQSRENLMSLYKAAAVFVLPSISRNEAFGIVLLEAMAVGTPVISTELHTGTSTNNIHGETGLVVDPKNIIELSNALKLILDDPQCAHAYGEQGSKRVKNHFSETTMINSLLDLCREAQSD